MPKETHCGQWLNGAIQPLEESSISRVESSYYGYSAFTSFLWPLEPRWLEAHLQRVTSHAAHLGMIEPTESLEAFQHGIVHWLQGTSASPSGLLRVRLTAFPASGGLETFSNQKIHTQWVIQAIPYTSQEQSKPLQLGLVRYTKALPHIKHGSLAEPFYLRRLAKQQGLDDVLWVNGDDHITEATSANVFFETVTGGSLQWVTPPLTQCLAGICRQQVMENALVKGQPIIERPIALEEIGITVCRGFLTNAIKGIQPFECPQPLPWVIATS
ncbi:MAG: aminotransferase class IV [Vampirovibrionales bacterium]|nr:aminotransferase class IV [Vampirovibrionales bacterium]